MTKNSERKHDEMVVETQETKSKANVKNVYITTQMSNNVELVFNADFFFKFKPIYSFYLSFSTYSKFNRFKKKKITESSQFKYLDKFDVQIRW